MRSTTACGTTVAPARHAPWSDPKINRLTDHGNEPALEDDLAARYYIAWDSQYLYLGAEVTDNSNDVSDPARTQALVLQRRNLLVYRSATHTASQKVRRGRQCVMFVIDACKPDYGHGGGAAAGQDVHRRTDSKKRPPIRHPHAAERETKGHFILEARIAMIPTLGVEQPRLACSSYRRRVWTQNRPHRSRRGRLRRTLLHLQSRRR